MTDEAKADQQFYLAPETEQAVIGALLSDPDTLPAVRALLKPEHFRCGVGHPGGSHEEIYQAICDLADTNNGYYNSRHVRDRLKIKRAITQDDEIALKLRLVDMMELSWPIRKTDQLIAECAHLQDFAIRREVLGLLGGIRGELQEVKSAAELVNSVLSKLNDVVSRTTGKVKSFTDLVTDYALSLADESPVQYQKTGFQQLDDIIDGFSPGDLVLVGARPSMGKTMFSTNLLANLAHQVHEKQGTTPVCFFSMEMEKDQILTKLYARAAQVPAKLLKLKQLTEHEWPKFYDAQAEISSYPIELFDSRDGIQTVAGVESQLRRLIGKGQKPAAVIIDYLGRMHAEDSKGNSFDRQHETEHIIRGLQNLAQQLAIPFVVLCQLSRKVEERPNKRPILSDLRDSGAIEQDADIVLFLYRDKYYNHQSEDDCLEVLVRKNRKGDIGTGPAVLEWIPETQTLLDSFKKYSDLAFYKGGQLSDTNHTRSRYRNKKGAGGPPLEVLP